MNKAHSVLMVDDDPDDQWLTTLAFKRVSPQYNVQFASDGREGVECILTNRVSPDLILLDLNMPFMNGFEVLQQIKQSVPYRHIPIVILTTSNDPGDVQKAYELGANGYLVKPRTHKELINIVEKLHHHWFDIAVLSAYRPGELV